MKHLLTKMTAACLMTCFCLAASANDIHVATTGNDDNAGTEAAPLLTIHKAMEIVQPGDRILVHEGTYMISKRIKIPALNTNPDLRCELRACSTIKIHPKPLRKKSDRDTRSLTSK